MKYFLYGIVLCVAYLIILKLGDGAMTWQYWSIGGCVFASFLVGCLK